MKVKIEADILGTEKEVSEINYILHLAFEHETLANFKSDLSQTEFFTLEYGFGNSHCWVKQYQFNIDGEQKYELRPERILFITE